MSKGEDVPGMYSMVEARARRRQRPEYAYTTHWMRWYGGQWSGDWELDAIYDTRDEFLEAVRDIRGGPGTAYPMTAEVWVYDETGDLGNFKVVAEYWPPGAVKP